MPTVTTNETFRHLTVRVDDLELRWSREEGALCGLRLRDGEQLIGHGPTSPTVDIAIAGPDRWRANYAFVRYLNHKIETFEDAVEIVIVIGIGPLKLYDTYRITGDLIARSVTVENVGLDEVQLWGVRMILPDACVGDAATCRFEAPGNSVRPRVPLDVAADQKPGVLPRRFFAPGLRENRAIESAPSQGPGLLALHAGNHDETLLCWYYSDVEPALPYIEGNKANGNPSPNQLAVSLAHEVKLAGWLGAGEKLTAGVQYIMPLPLAWEEALLAFQRTWPICGLKPLEHAAPWVRDAAIYELHPSYYGGFSGLKQALPALRDLGINTLYLLPIWEFDNRKGRLWDGNWQLSGSLYAILDFNKLDPTLGSEEELRDLIDTAHALDMRVLFDLVTQGCARTAHYVQENPEWFCRDPQGNFISSHGWNDTYSFDWNNPSYQETVLKWALHQVERYDIDGFRVHAPYDKEPNWSRLVESHASATSLGVLKLLDKLQVELKRIKPEGVLLCELYGPVYTRNHDFCYDYVAHQMFFHLGLGRISPAELGEWLEEHHNALPPNVVRVCFTETHNTRTLNPLADGMRGSLISHMLLFGMVLCGYVPMLWYGQELGDEQFVRALLRARASTPALRYGRTLYNVVPSDFRQVFVVLREYEGQYVLGLLNCSPHKRTVLLSLPIDMMNLNEGKFQLYDLLAEAPWNEDGRTSWKREELLNLCITLDPYRAYGFEIQAVPELAPQTALDSPETSESVNASS